MFDQIWDFLFVSALRIYVWPHFSNLEKKTHTDNFMTKYLNCVFKFGRFETFQVLFHF